MPVSYFIKKSGVLNSFGSDVTDFLNRMSTNDFRKFNPNEFKKTVLTTDKGRIIDLVTTVKLNDRILLLTGINNLSKVLTHLNKYIIADDVEFKKKDEQYAKILIYSENSDEISNLLGTEIPEKNKVMQLGENDFLFIENLKTKTVCIVCSENNVQDYKNKLSDFRELNFDEYNLIRIEEGIPEDVNELNEDINPLECGLKEYISFNKGCYIGQEVIARLDSQGKIPKQMIKIESNSQISNGDKIYLNEKETGFITSSAVRNGVYKGLGFIRNTDLDLNQSYHVNRNKENFKINISKIN